MFWIGMIVGVIITVIAAFAYVRICMKLVNVSTEEFWEGTDVLATAWSNRESEVLVLHDGEILATYAFEENE